MDKSGTLRCALCREEISDGEPVRYRGKDYCCDACAFEASVRIGSICGSHSTVEASRRYSSSADRKPSAATGAGHPSLIAIDGPVAVGKSSVGMRLARRLGYRFVDTGAMYRALTWKALKLNIEPDDREGLARLAETTDIGILSMESGGQGYRVTVDGEDVTERIRSNEVEGAVSLVSSVPEVRHVMVRRQREMAGEGRIVVVGRDIGTVVLPQADLKVFLTASPEKRAIRRHQELLARGKDADIRQVVAYLEARDNLDSTREVSPLKPAPDSRVVDTGSMTLEEVVDYLYGLARSTSCA